MLISSVLLVQADEGVSFLVVDRIGDFYRNLPRRADVIVTTVGARHKCQQDKLTFTSNLLCNNYYNQGPSNADPPPAKPTQATAQGPKNREATAGSYELNQHYPTPSNSAESSKQHKTGSEHLPQQARTKMLTDYTRDMSSRTSPASSKRPKAISNRSVSARGVQRYHSYFNWSCLPSAIEEDKVR
ncbi:protein IQ-DOMAIN 1-like [Dorcoceras hygrometricum]|uniref:Protein IQ-DOMAIN 1-like n=1 Tax=Dorcoceras hygrometricum TaxID=472368 RepID=A0A2Z7BSL4_9LAMI|nr:protein IQ-DOMAIN 1-like [Dorcoceras hygrometricum]